MTTPRAASSQSRPPPSVWPATATSRACAPTFRSDAFLTAFRARSGAPAECDALVRDAAWGITRCRRWGREAKKTHSWVVPECGLLSLPARCSHRWRSPSVGATNARTASDGRVNEGSRKSKRDARYALTQVSLSKRRTQGLSSPTASGTWSRLPPFGERQEVERWSRPRAHAVLRQRHLLAGVS